MTGTPVLEPLMRPRSAKESVRRSTDGGRPPNAGAGPARGEQLPPCCPVENSDVAGCAFLGQPATSADTRSAGPSPSVPAYFAGFINSVPNRPFVAGEPRSLGSTSAESSALSPSVPAYSRAAAPTPSVRFGMPTARSGLPSPL